MQQSSTNKRLEMGTMPRCQRTEQLLGFKIEGQKHACQYAKRFRPIGVHLMADKMNAWVAQMPATAGLAAQGHRCKLRPKGITSARARKGYSAPWGSMLGGYGAVSKKIEPTSQGF